MSLINIQLDQQKKILIVIFFILILFVDVNYVLKAQRSGLKGLDSRISKLNTDLSNLTRGLENMRLAKNNLDQTGQKKPAAPSQLLAESRISELLQEISVLANKFNVKISQIRSSRQVEKEKSIASQNKLTGMTVNLELSCDYHSLGKFIQSLEESPVFMSVQGLEISTQLPDYMKQKVTLVLKTYVTK